MQTDAKTNNYSLTEFIVPKKTACLFIFLFSLNLIILYKTPDIISDYIGYVNAYLLSFFISFTLGLIVYFLLFFRKSIKIKFNRFIFYMILSLLFLQAINLAPAGEHVGLTYLLTRNNIIYFFIMIFIGPFYEEVFFRGCLFNALCTLASSIGGGIIPPILITCLAFSLSHNQYDTISAYGFEFIVSCILTVIRIRTNGLFWPIAGHSILNAFAVLLTIYLYI